MQCLKERKQAFTLVEVIAVVIIIGVLSALALPLFSKTFEVTRAKQAVASLRQIRAGERIYRTGEGFYYPYSGTVSDINTINTQLRVFLEKHSGRSWNYSIASPGVSAFTATATRTSGRYTNKTLSIDQDGNVDDSNWPLGWP